MLAISLGLLLAIHGVESGWAPVSRPGDAGRALGPLQLHRAAVVDSRTGHQHAAVTNEVVAYAVAASYLRRYNSRIVTLDDAGRLYNGGPRKPVGAGTDTYVERLALTQVEVEAARTGWLAYLDNKVDEPPKGAAAKAVWRHVRHKPDVRRALVELFTEPYAP